MYDVYKSNALMTFFFRGRGRGGGGGHLLHMYMYMYLMYFSFLWCFDFQGMDDGISDSVHQGGGWAPWERRTACWAEEWTGLMDVGFAGGDVQGFIIIIIFC